MRKFSELNISASAQGLKGKKISIDEVLNKEIIVEAYRIANSKYDDKGNGKCLYLQIKLDNEERVVFSGSVVLQDIIEQVPADDFPFQTTIIKRNKRYEFT